ncbi:uncharacterized protein CANTADRAFT_5625 [Suhomyces tanzawaensis NRRL Y-17324]|uniref:Major facilitator superfamily (MFS) profile domain-containing protein n=1 Tax=Suhomyces tanzawaensis NRRL Y-17324 TaxID=984487 RepID=A0A1E4SKB9_9ASCO|nr:uncharacterized protein CANTADRAFT_5625 [Suhomyces tanzawaensis NRRL Y-17324]ODV79940.1 hypothetical protein CANTADRAFT_5625 [Suhomyces tanzawaensis NRRL Y-17324]
MDHPHVQIKESWLVGRALLNFTSIFVSLGVFLFGFEQGLMSSLLTNKFFKSYYNNPTPAEVGTMIAILEIGALFSSFVAGKVGDKVGRRRTIRIGSFIFVVGGIIQASSVNILNLAGGRFISGIAIGFLTTIIPCYQSEISPPDDRGFYACLEFTGNIVGYSASIWVDYGFSYIQNDLSWRSPLVVQCVVGLALYLGSFVIVETPRWLLDHDHNYEGMIVIADLYADGDVEDESARDEYRNIKESILLARIEGGERSYRYLFTKYTKRLSVACFSQMFAQMNGINIISYYAPMIFESAGWVGRDAILMTGINSIIYILSTIPPWYLVDAWGRKPLLLSGAVLMAVPLSLISYSLYLNNQYTAHTVVACVIVTNAAFGYSWGPIPWLMSEVFPNSVRSKGAAMATATNWLFNFIVGEMTPILLDSIKWKTYLIPALSCVLSFLAVEFLFPETKGLNLEDMGSVFDDNSSIFSFHSSGASNYGSTDGIDVHRTSVAVDSPNHASSINEVFRQSGTPSSAASKARNPALMRPEYDGIITGTPPPPPPPQLAQAPLKPVQSDASSVSDGYTQFDPNAIPQEIQPPSLEEILHFKLQQLKEPNGFVSFYRSIFGPRSSARATAKNADEESQLLQAGLS